jgi:hypothetical protein
MSRPRTLSLFDETVQPSSWNERMTAGEYAIHYSDFSGFSGNTPSCTVFGSLAEALAYASDQISHRPTLRCRIYDSQGFIGKPIRELRGSSYKGENDLSPRFRRWGGSVLFLGGLLLIVLDWMHDFTLSWPAMIGMRMIFPGLALLITEIVIVFYARRKREDVQQGRAA